MDLTENTAWDEKPFGSTEEPERGLDEETRRVAIPSWARAPEGVDHDFDDEVTMPSQAVGDSGAGLDATAVDHGALFDEDALP